MAGSGIPLAVPVTWRSERSKTLDWRSGLGRSVRTSRFFGYRDLRDSVRVSVKDALLGLFGYRPRQLCSKCERRLSLSNAGLSDPLKDQRYPQRPLQQPVQLRDEISQVTADLETCGVPEEKLNPKKDRLHIGRKKFNMDPKKGIEYLVQHGLLVHETEDVAQFLYKGEGLNKTAIGEYLGERHDFNIAVLKAFVCLNDFSGMILVQALRQFLWSFRLPGEAQKIDRMMECFAQRYCSQNPDIFKSTDTCYVLSFAIIMLNTSLHNPAVKDKPTVDRFIAMNRGINDGGDLPPELLEDLYNSIKKEPFKIPEDDGNDLMHTFFNPVKEGWLCKEGGHYKTWKRRWFILNDNCLYYFQYTTDKEPKGIIPLENVAVREITIKGQKHCFEIHSATNDYIKAAKTNSEGKVVEGKHMVYKISASSAEDKDDWIRSIRSSITDNPFYDLLSARRRKAIQTR